MLIPFWDTNQWHNIKNWENISLHVDFPNLNILSKNVNPQPFS
jgi:hypothetical protein